MTPQYRNGRKLTPHQLMEAEAIVGMLEMRSEKGRSVVRLWKMVGSVKGPDAELWLPRLTAMFSDTFRLTGIERAPNGAWMHQTWYCEVGGGWRHDEHRATQRDLTNPTT